MLRRLGCVALLATLAACASRQTFEGDRAHQPRRGVASSFDPAIRRAASEEIDRAVVERQAVVAAVVVLDSATGQILAMEGRDRGRDDPDRASTGGYVTGSTLKTLTIAAALDAGTIRLGERVDCTTRSYGEAKLYDVGEHGILSVSDVLAVSSNVGTSRVYDTLGLDRLVAALRRFHVGDPPGSVPIVADGTSIEAANLAGGELARATPLQMAAAYAAIFNDGVYRKPTLSNGLGLPERVLGSQTARAMVAMLEAAVANDLGTGKLARIPGMKVAGKTGTADLSLRHDDGDVYASFIGTVLDREPHVVVFVGLEAPRKGENGPSAAAPTFARIARRIMGEGGLPQASFPPRRP